MNTPMSIQPRKNELAASQRLLLGSPAHESQQPLTLQDVLRVLKRRRRAALIFAGGVLALVVLYLAFATRRYAGEATLEFDKQNADMLGVNAGAAGATDTLDYNITLQTQADILESDTLALQVIKELNLEQTTGRRVSVLKKFHNNLKVDVVAGSRMIKITFLSTDRYLASAGANKVLNDYIDYSFQTRYNATTQATGWLSKQL